MSENINSVNNNSNINNQYGEEAANIEMSMSDRTRLTIGYWDEILRDIRFEGARKRGGNGHDHHFTPPCNKTGRPYDECSGLAEDVTYWISLYHGTEQEREQKNIEECQSQYQDAVEEREKAREEYDKWLCSDERKAILSDDDVLTLTHVIDAVKQGQDGDSHPYDGLFVKERVITRGLGEYVATMCAITDRCTDNCRGALPNESRPWDKARKVMWETIYLYYKLDEAEQECMWLEWTVDPVLRDYLYDLALSEWQDKIEWASEPEHIGKVYSDDWYEVDDGDEDERTRYQRVYDGMKTAIENSRKNRTK